MVICSRPVPGMEMPIVGAVDRSDRASAVVRQAAELAELYETELHVVHVASLSEASARDEVGSPTLELDRARREAAETATRAALDVLDSDSFEAVGLVGDAAHELINYCEDNDAEFLVVSGRKRSPLGKAVFGSVTQTLLLRAPLPVVSVLSESE